MCLSTVYQNEHVEDNVYCKYVAHIDIDGDNLTFTDVMGEKFTTTGRLISVDLTGGGVVFQAL